MVDGNKWQPTARFANSSASQANPSTMFLHSEEYWQVESWFIFRLFMQICFVLFVGNRAFLMQSTVMVVAKSINKANSGKTSIVGELEAFGSS